MTGAAGHAGIAIPCHGSAIACRLMQRPEPACSCRNVGLLQGPQPTVKALDLTGEQPFSVPYGLGNGALVAASR